MTLEASSLSIAVPGRCLISGLNLRLTEGENWAVLGANGCGKSLLLKTLAGLRSDSESVTLDGQPLEALSARKRAREISILLQEPDGAPDGTVLEAVLAARYAHIPAWHWETEKDIEFVKSALDRVDLGEYSGRALDTLSGGERRRCAIAAVLAQQTRIALWDEPTNHLDLHHQMATLRMLSLRAKTEGVLNVFVLHDVNIAIRVCTHALLLFGDGNCLAGPVGEVINEANLSRLYRWRIRRATAGDATLYFPQ